MSGKLSTHALDTYHGRPAENLKISLYRFSGASESALLKAVTTNADGRTNGPLLGPEEMEAGVYELVFEVGSYFEARGVVLPAPAFLTQVPVRFTIGDAGQSYHVPLLFSPWAYSTYREVKMDHPPSLAERTLDRIHQLAAISDELDTLQRTFLSPAMKRANALVAGWMREAGCVVSEDGWGNLIGHLPGTSAKSRTLLLGSHLDTVPNAGKFDGPLGVLVALASLELLKDQHVHLSFHVDVVGFSDEEGTRFHSAYLGSKALAGAIDHADLQLVDAQGISVGHAVASHQGVKTLALPAPRYLPDELLGYIEVHIEQGPVLEQMKQPLGIVAAIAAQTRLVYTVTGRAGHAGTTPMDLRRDALAGAAELVLAVEQTGRQTSGLVATTGQLVVRPGASNVIPDQVRLTVDIRHADREVADKACARLASEAEEIALRRALKIEHTTVQSMDGVLCSPLLIAQLSRAVKKQQDEVPELVSGAGHDGIILSRVAPVGMLFVRCQGGLSHHPDEHVTLGDIDAAITALATVLRDWK